MRPETCIYATEILSFRRTEVCMYFILILLLFIAGSYAQLGEAPEIEEKLRVNKTNFETKNHLHNKGVHKIAKSSEGQLSPVNIAYIACINGSAISDSILYLNLTQFKESEDFWWGDSEISACFMLCKNSNPTFYISVQKSFGNSTQSCGCHDDWQNVTQEVRSSMCDDTPGFLNIYCGPTNFDCLISSSSSSRGNLLSILIPLILVFVLKR